MAAPHKFYAMVLFCLLSCEQDWLPDCEEGADYSFAAEAGCKQAISDGFSIGYRYGLHCEEPSESSGVGYSESELVCDCKTVGNDVGEGWNPCDNEWTDGYSECFESGLQQGNYAGWIAGQCP